jgi:nitrogenase subunit NifH
VIAIYGKGGSGKSFALANLSYMMARQGKRVLLIGCDPKSDTTSLLFGGKSCPTIIETSAAKKLAGEEVRIEDVCFQRDGVFAMELGGPKSAAAAAARASSMASSCSRNSASTNGASTTSCSTSWATWCAAASACRSRATCARR